MSDRNDDYLFPLRRQPSTRTEPGQYHRKRVEQEKADPEFRAEYDLARTAAPRTTAGRDLLATAYLAGDAASEGVSLLDAILAIEAEAAAPAGLDVEAFRQWVIDELASERGTVRMDIDRIVEKYAARLLQGKQS